MVAAMLLAGAAQAQTAGFELYSARAIVTGTDGRMRLEGFDRCLRDVLVKVSGDPALADDPRAAVFEPGAEALAEDFFYQDRMSGQPMHDEQGSRDRPYDLTVRFSPARIDAILDTLGAAPWLGPRPPLVLMLSISRNGETYQLTADGAPDERPRQAAVAAGAKYGMRVVFPPHDSALPDIPGLPEIPGAVALHGTLAWKPEAFGWVGDWRIAAHGSEVRWGVAGVSFDEAFRDAVRGAMKALR